MGGKHGNLRIFCADAEHFLLTESFLSGELIPEKHFIQVENSASIGEQAIFPTLR